MPILSTPPVVEEVVTKAPATLDNILTLSLVGLLAVIVIIAVVRKAILNKKAENTVVEVLPVETAPAPVAPGSAGQLKLHDVEPKTAAMLMAIVADKLGKPLNELHFISIKEVK